VDPTRHQRDLQGGMGRWNRVVGRSTGHIADLPAVRDGRGQGARPEGAPLRLRVRPRPRRGRGAHRAATGGLQPRNGASGAQRAGRGLACPRSRPL
jgi:hypothetical protein